MSVHKQYMQRALQLAKIGLANALPNPSVGAVIVYKDTIIGEGYTSAFGGSHSEVNAINSVKNQALLKESTLYVTLEPCSHFGKTPPCANLIVEKKIPKVVIGCVDPFAKVSGKGIQILKDNGIEVITGVLEKECQQSHKRFFTFHLKKRPYIILKWAESADGFIAPISKNENKPVWLSNVYSRQLTHKWRSEEMAILVGKQTILDDNPSLTTRDWKGKNPVRLFIDARNEIDNSFQILNNESETYRFTKIKKSEKDVVIPFENTVKEICDFCFNQNIQSVIIEGGQKTFQSFIDAKQWDEARVFKTTVILNNGITAPKLCNYQKTTSVFIENDCLCVYRKKTK
ncbi:bifunctional diaminohydroxyphosphoribosylaminopyrimidine deaminase/5-amino-6-(5-phosphoribosylamino)uracil reductase RibD [Flavobacterium dauae]|uniref:bifunctional diaminohydroxyphosphoribosylaminopyrimidine deaminase/5-amino-6-(5-phosphoribosylamino)uracil reductase RibD n=1 Tax=Flavobacterium dauae TaxID=1563479 RepID=UPI00101B45D4|nr:bifunctional diaminohydroxyphosphoribosylaminopyrimidine deaminase/5-amino-6-(5-phosphoribosylamino)uracil reductase RibD [Flavobacterium dauae]WLD24618.1 bifunctional diaminohydroxyphosphoribosylaminopyrimidine deaminase/5-amino-6-(5-phosphoribosylamino)uracil reductase RibD [Flavobacterium dauae]